MVGGVHILVRDIFGVESTMRHRHAVRSPEEPAVPVVFLDGIPRLVHQPVMPVAQQYQIISACLATVCPVLNMMGIDESFVFTAREPAASVPGPQRPFNGFGNGAGLAPDA